MISLMLTVLEILVLEILNQIANFACWILVIAEKVKFNI